MSRCALLIIVSILLITGCKKDDAPPAGWDIPHDAVPANILPLIKGHSYTFGGYLTTGSSETKIDGSEDLKASWTMIGDTTLASVFPAPMISHLTVTRAVLIIDSVSATGKPLTRTPVFVYKNSTTGDYYYLTNFGNFFRTYTVRKSDADTVIRGDSLRFIKLSPGGATLNSAFTVFSESFRAYYLPAPVTINLSIEGLYEKKSSQTITLKGADTVVTTYQLTVTNKPSIGTTALATSVNAKFLLADGIGPIQFFLAGDSDGPGSLRNITGKNF